MSTDTTAPVPLAGADMAFEYYGVHFDPIGEEGAPLMALGHVEPRRMVAAANRYYRVDVGDPLDWHQRSRRWLPSVEHRHAVRVTQCDEVRDEEHSPDCRICAEAGLPHGWYVRWNVGPDTPGAFPVTLLEV